jgi:glycosyltransferase involved in cell wall biosynthesis
MKVDLYWGKDSNKMFGMNRCKIELLKGLPDNINKQKITYTPKNRILNYIDLLTYAPLSTIQKRRKGAIAHILSQSEAHILNLFTFKKSVVLCFDIIPYIFNYASKASRIKARFSYKGMCKADHITAISQFTKDEIIKHLKYPAEKITVAYIGVDHDKYKPIKDTQKIKEKYKLNANKQYLFYIGNEEPRMNIETILLAIKELKVKYPNIHFLKVGSPNFPRMREKLQKQIRELGIQDNVSFLGYVPEKDLPLLYNAADINVYMCEYAGFGLPPLEGMACGTPTITTNKSSLTEVAGNGAITLEPKDYKALAQAIEKILEYKEFREDLIQKGIDQAKKFTWVNFVNKHIEVYNKLNEQTA